MRESGREGYADLPAGSRTAGFHDLVRRRIAERLWGESLIANVVGGEKEGEAMTMEGEIVSARIRNSAKRAEIREMLETATEAQKAAVTRIAAQLLPESGTELEKLNAVYDNLLKREQALKNPTVL